MDSLDCLKLYLFGKEVDGTAYVLFGVLHNDQKYSLPSSLQKVPITSGRGEVTLRTEQLTQAFPNVLHLVGSSIFVRVHVLTESGSEMVKAELKNIPIVSSAYSINFKNTPKYFKPGMIFDVTGKLTNSLCIATFSHVCTFVLLFCFEGKRETHHCRHRYVEKLRCLCL